MTHFSELPTQRIKVPLLTQGDVDARVVDQHWNHAKGVLDVAGLTDISTFGPGIEFLALEVCQQVGALRVYLGSGEPFVWVLLRRSHWFLVPVPRSEVNFPRWLAAHEFKVGQQVRSKLNSPQFALVNGEVTKVYDDLPGLVMVRWPAREPQDILALTIEPQD